MKLEKSIVTQYLWNEKNKQYDHEISLLIANANTVQAEFRDTKAYIDSPKHFAKVQVMIDNTM